MRRNIESKENKDDIPEGMEPVNMHGLEDYSDYNDYRSGRERKAYGQALSEEKENNLTMERQKCRDIASKQLQKYALKIRKKAENKEFAITGVKIALLSKSVVPGLTNTSKDQSAPKFEDHVVPDSVAKGYKICERALSNRQTEDPIEALVEFVATMQFAATEGAHGGQTPRSKAYYNTFLPQKPEEETIGQTLFSESSPVLVAEFDAAVESKLTALCSEKYSESQLQEYLKKFGITSAEQDFIEFKEKMQKDTQNVATINALVSRLKKPENMSEAVFNEGQKLLLDTLTRMTLTFSKTDLIHYTSSV